ncbi:hypothetical protein OG949_20120 [Streptomyces scopuliridis]|uniref:hypothetical protein n=1 Tax=Streptomyces scopuliridis TaxID=452529 RepID=UPI002DDC5D96|nr:hypothetical protein [Streptomyces scopuliridis]WSB34937.1 hypothetical protein OG949_20120 [Streptomyces scopuliridis]
MADRASAFAEIQDTSLSYFFSYVRSITYATMITVDRENRPRARVLLPVWEVVDGHPVGWLAVHRTPVKTAHLASNPHTTYTRRPAGPGRSRQVRQRGAAVRGSVVERSIRPLTV